MREWAPRAEGARLVRTRPALRQRESRFEWGGQRIERTVRRWRTIIFELADGAPCPGRETASELPRLVELRRWDVRRWTLGPGARGVDRRRETENCHRRLDDIECVFDRL